MNLFFLDSNLEKCAQSHIDRHVSKIILECAQCLSTAHNFNREVQLKECYRAAYVNHPTTVWVRTSLDNYVWACNYGLALYDEFKERNKRQHKSGELIKNWLSKNVPNISSLGFTEFYQAVPEKYKNDCPIEAYRDYYVGDKQYDKSGYYMFKMRGRDLPEWAKQRMTTEEINTFYKESK